MKPRGILPTYVTDEKVVLCKAAPAIRNAYEIRLVLFMAMQTGRTFALGVTPTAKVDDAFEAHILKHGGNIIRGPIRDHSVYVGAIAADGEELDGWVAGDNQTWVSILAAMRSAWLRDSVMRRWNVCKRRTLLVAGRLAKETIRACNIDDENVQAALLRLASEAADVGGSVFVQ